MDVVERHFRPQRKRGRGDIGVGLRDHTDGDAEVSAVPFQITFMKFVVRLLGFLGSGHVTPQSVMMCCGRRLTARRVFCWRCRGRQRKHCTTTANPRGVVRRRNNIPACGAQCVGIRTRSLVIRTQLLLSSSVVVTFARERDQLEYAESPLFKARTDLRK